MSTASKATAGTKSEAAESGFEKCERLLTNPDVQWFIEEAITRARLEKERELRALATPKDTREIAAHVREALQQAEDFLQRQRDIYARLIRKDD